MAGLILAIDPGPVQSAYVIWDGSSIIEKDLIDNHDLLDRFYDWNQGSVGSAMRIPMVIEQVRSYGMAVGATVFDTVFWTGRFYERWGDESVQMPRIEVKKHICHNGAAKDSNIIQALIDRFAYGVPNKGKGTIRAPGFFHGFKKDIWQAFALAVTWHDQRHEEYPKTTTQGCREAV